MQAAEVSFWRAVDKVALPETGGGSDDTPADGGGQEGPVAADEKEGDSPSRLPGEPARSREPPPLSAVPEICDSLVAALQIQKQLLQRVMNDVLSQLLVDRAARGKRLVARMHAFFTYSKKTFESWIRHYDLAGPGPFTVKQSTAYALLADLVRDSEKSLETLQKWFYVMSWRKSVVEY
ncbi:hypothetical protein CSUI_010090 [Cystoisospora suis]|uniref:Uncharacterized protein n=1 Tax=Cystoisospora suis TaxID=483139 RepID=A0A2C6KIC8_9APIC|nr:hypothetical protein CSUI_010090 [Cystoisospora suis]